MAIVTTTQGDMDTSLLEDTSHTEVLLNGTSNVTEYRLNGEVVHRSVHFVFNQDVQPTPV
jgi:hypothetical protein